jgi:endoglucanase
MRIMYCSGVWSYIVNSMSTPLFILIPCITIWFGVFPIVVSWWMALGVTVYYFSTNSVLYYVRSLRHFEALWFANISNALLWWTYVKAFWRAINSVCGQKIQFKTTLKGASLLMNTMFRDLWMPAACFTLLAVSVVFGLVKLFSGPTISSPLAISIIWAIYAGIPHFLVLFYALISRGTLLKYMCWLCITMSFGCGILAVILMWSLFPQQYDVKQALNMSNFFYYAQRAGILPDNTVPWRGDALTYETGPGGADMTGGWLQVRLMLIATNELMVLCCACLSGGLSMPFL